MIILKNIVLIGMSGVGKTTIGKALSIALDRKFIDTDSLIEEESGISINDIFTIYGEDYFRKLECRVISELYEEENLIISTGGGIVLNNTNITMLKEKGILILLESSVESIVNNIKDDVNVRPLLNNKGNIYKKVEEMYNSRKRLYISSADFVVFVDGKSIDEIIYEILRRCVKIKS